MTNFWQLLKESTIMQAILSLVVVGAYVYMLIAGVPVSDAFVGIVGLVIGFFFGGKLGVATATQRNAVDNLNAIVQASQPSNKEDN